MSACQVIALTCQDYVDMSANHVSLSYIYVDIPDNFYFYFYTVDLQRDMHYADFGVQASTIVHGLKTGNTSKIYN